MVTRYYANLAIPDTLADAISNAATSIVTGSGAPSGYPQSFPWTLRLEPGTANEELVSVTAGAGTSATPWTVTRGYDGTTAKAHNAGVAIAHGMSAGDLATSRTHESLGSGSGVHGLPAAAWNATAFAVVNETTLSNSTTSSVSWSSIPQTYKHLLIVCQARLTETTLAADNITAICNGDSGAYYSDIELNTSSLSGTLAGAGTYEQYAQPNWPLFYVAASQSGAAVNAGGGIAWIPNYTSTAFNKMAISMSGMGAGTVAAAALRQRYFFYNPPAQAALTALTVSVASGYFLSGSTFCLYGVG